MNDSKKKEAAKMAVAVKPIKPTIITDPEIARAVIREATTTPTENGRRAAQKASELLRKLRK